MRRFDLQGFLEYCWRNYCFCEAYRRLTGMAPWVVLPKFDVPWEVNSLPPDGRRY